jgi:hypothetical protein
LDRSLRLASAHAPNLGDLAIFIAFAIAGIALIVFNRPYHRFWMSRFRDTADKPPVRYLIATYGSAAFFIGVGLVGIISVAGNLH